jgi:hypothetical protein
MLEGSVSGLFFYTKNGSRLMKKTFFPQKINTSVLRFRWGTGGGALQTSNFFTFLFLWLSNCLGIMPLQLKIPDVSLFTIDYFLYFSPCLSTRRQQDIMLFLYHRRRRFLFVFPLELAPATEKDN